MLGLSSEILEKIRDLLEDYFDDMILSLLGLVVDEDTNELIFDDSKDSIASLYIKALNSKVITEEEEDVLRGLLSVTNDYAEALKNSTKASVTNELNAYAQGQNIKKEPISSNKIESIVNKQMEVAGNKFNIIAGAQSNTSKNVALLSAFSKMSGQNKEEDAIVFFRPVPVDSVTAPATLQVHLLLDQVTPKLYYIKELNSNYYKKGDKVASIHGTHPYCRCAFSYLAHGYGFNSEGKIIYISKGHNELEEQRKKFPLT